MLLTSYGAAQAAYTLAVPDVFRSPRDAKREALFHNDAAPAIGESIGL